MIEEPTEALKEFIQTHESVRDGVQAVLDRQRAAGGSGQEAYDALKTYLLGQMYGPLRQTNPLLAAVEEARQARDLNWWWLLYELGWEARETVDNIPW